MLDLLYIGLVALPLTIAAVALLTLAWRGLRGEGAASPDVREVGRAVLEALGPDPEPAPEPAVGRPPLADLSDMVRSLARPWFPTVPAAPAAGTKRCPDCAEE